MASVRSDASHATGSLVKQMKLDQEAIRAVENVFGIPAARLSSVSVRARHPVLAPRLLVHYSYERIGSDA
jgi:hypothetical protein